MNPVEAAQVAAIRAHAEAHRKTNRATFSISGIELLLKLLDALSKANSVHETANALLTEERDAAKRELAGARQWAANERKGREAVEAALAEALKAGALN